MKGKRIIVVILLLFVAWIVADINYPFKTAIDKIDAVETARLDGAMWRSYYEKKPFKLFMQSAQLMRIEFHLPFWRSYFVAYFPAKAAFVFKDGTNRGEYAKALPYLVKYYGHINDVSKTTFNADSAAASELEWWIIRRERDKHAPKEWEQLLAKTASTIYHVPAEKFDYYAGKRVEAMLLRDGKGDNITEEDWAKIDALLLEAWQSFSESIKNN